MYFVYLLKCKDTTIYTGITTNLERRFEEHKKGMGARYTRGHKVGKIVYFERKRNRSTASKREAEIKSWTRAQKLMFIKKHSANKIVSALVRTQSTVRYNNPT